MGMPHLLKPLPRHAESTEQKHPPSLVLIFLRVQGLSFALRTTHIAKEPKLKIPKEKQKGDIVWTRLRFRLPACISPEIPKDTARLRRPLDFESPDALYLVPHDGDYPASPDGNFLTD